MAAAEAEPGVKFCSPVEDVEAASAAVSAVCAVSAAVSAVCVVSAAGLPPEGSAAHTDRMEAESIRIPRIMGSRIRIFVFVFMKRQSPIKSKK